MCCGGARSLGLVSPKRMPSDLRMSWPVRPRGPTSCEGSYGCGEDLCALLTRHAEALDGAAHCVGRALAAHRVEQRRRGAGTADQALGIRQHDRVVPGTLHHERQLERSARVTARTHELRRAGEVDIACRNGG